MELASNVTLVTNILMMVISDLENASRLYDKLFESIIRINYSATVYKQLDRLVHFRLKVKAIFCKLIHVQVLERLHPMVGEICQNEALHSSLFNQFSLAVPLQIFELCYSFRRFYNFGKLLQQSERKCLQLYK